ncbi:hypothetical protein NECAME_14380 [Necator americanus]|uniref:Progestin and adipoQ receptor family member 3 n=1 Tax=Necator americanus TaxID=51031 RepID=W2SNE6_NECAM|nr:hypothetical protein NECAME_14380 [Necator americanus]ETN71058.1 hypothetical protein NECAME_14380 [Necator americanus]
MRRCLRCRSHELCRDHGSYRLVTRDKLRPSMWINQYVMRHYRPTNMTYSMCAKSVFHWTNETINIWSHLLGFVYFTYRQYEMNAYRIPLMGGHFQDHLVISLSLFGAQKCLIDIFVLYGLVAAAFFFYVTLLPERLSPGTFDLIGCSHQWWHVLILSAMVYWQHAGAELLSFYRMKHSSCEDVAMTSSWNSSAIS